MNKKEMEGIDVANTNNNTATTRHQCIAFNMMEHLAASLEVMDIQAMEFGTPLVAVHPCKKDDTRSHVWQVVKGEGIQEVKHPITKRTEWIIFELRSSNLMVPSDIEDTEEKEDESNNNCRLFFLCSPILSEESSNNTFTLLSTPDFTPVARSTTHGLRLFALDNDTIRHQLGLTCVATAATAGDDVSGAVSVELLPV